MDEAAELPTTVTSIEMASGEVMLVSDQSEWKSVSYEPDSRVWHVYSADNKGLVTIPNEAIRSVRTRYVHPISTPHAPLEEPHRPHRERKKRRR